VPSTEEEEEVDLTGWPTISANPSDDFVRTIGVAMHHHYGDTAYGEHDLIGLLDRLGVRQIRDALTPQSMGFYREFVAQAGPGAGVSYILNDGEEMSIEDQLRMLDAEAPGTASQVESDNEPDCDGWQDGEVADYHSQARSIRALMDSLPSLRRVPLTTPSFCRSSESHYSAYGDDGVSDRFNMHPYTGGRPPEAEIGSILAIQRTADSDAVPVVTEGGFHSAVNNSDGHLPTSERAQAAYLPRLFLEYAARGIVLSHTYELIDQQDDPSRSDRESNFGLFRADGSIKPSGGSLAALTRTLADTGPRPEVREVPLRTEGGGDELRTQAFVRSDGSIDVAMWRAVEIWDPSDRQDLDNPDEAVTIELPEESTVSFVRIDGVENPDRRQLGTGTTFSIPVSANPTIVRLS
jgi:hypothetical protein